MSVFKVGVAESAVLSSTRGANPPFEYVLPPMFKLPAIPAPPATIRAPVVVEVEVVVAITTKLLSVLVPIFVFA